MGSCGTLAESGASFWPGLSYPLSSPLSSPTNGLSLAHLRFAARPVGAPPRLVPADLFSAYLSSAYVSSAWASALPPPSLPARERRGGHRAPRLLAVIFNERGRQGRRGGGFGGAPLVGLLRAFLRAFLKPTRRREPRLQEREVPGAGGRALWALAVCAQG